MGGRWKRKANGCKEAIEAEGGGGYRYVRHERRMVVGSEWYKKIERVMTGEHV